MDYHMLHAAYDALVLLLEPHRLMFLAFGVLIGLAIGILPGIGGLAGLALLLPFTFTMDPYTAFAFLLGMLAVNSTSDTIPAVLFGVPGSAGAQATVLDGLPMAKKGEAGRALSAAFAASVIGGLFGAVLLAVTLPFLRGIAMYIGSPELLGFAVFGISMVAVLSGRAPLRGLAAAALGIMLALVGIDSQTATLRWTQGSLYLWDGLPLIPVTMGLFALPELAELAIRRTTIAANGSTSQDVTKGMAQGLRDVLTNWKLVLRCSWLGAALGAIPGIGASIIDWLAYGHALRTEKDAASTFGKGDVRGVIAPESANNAREAGSLVPTIAFGIPGGAGAAILLGAFLVHGLVPGPEMLTKNLSVTYSMVWSLAIANILGAGLCFLFSPYLAKLATMRFTLIIPSVLSITIVGAYSASGNWGDLYLLLACGVLGWVMKQLRWPRPPLILGFVLGAIIERYMFITINRFGFEWLLRPIVVVLFLFALLSMLRPLIQDIRNQGGFKAMLRTFGRPSPHPSDLFPVLLLGFLGMLVWQAQAWPYAARLIPTIVGSFGLFVVAASLMTNMMRRSPVSMAAQAQVNDQRLHVDVGVEEDDLSPKQVALRGFEFLAWLIGFMVSMALIGFVPTLPVFVVSFMLCYGERRAVLILSIAGGLTALVFFLFDRFLHLPWPPSLLGDLVPALRAIIPSV
jgi:TctA family transporter